MGIRNTRSCRFNSADVTILLKISTVVLSGLAISVAGLVYLESLAVLLLGLLIAMPGAAILLIVEVTRQLTSGAQTKTTPAE